jgi:surface antigen
VSILALVMNKMRWLSSVVILPLLVAAMFGSACLDAPAGIAAPAESEGATGPQVDPRAVGAVIGGILAHRVARGMDEADRRMAAEAEYQAMEFGEPGTSTAWENPATQHRGVIVPEKPYPQGDEYCRAYTHTVDLGGAGDTIRDIACRTPDGVWRAGGRPFLSPT